MLPLWMLHTQAMPMSAVRVRNFALERMLTARFGITAALTGCAAVLTVSVATCLAVPSLRHASLTHGPE
jgi:hypothetical protein